MAVLGDSISQGFAACCRLGDHPEHAWATGDAPGDGVRSHLERLRAAVPAIARHGYDDARTGAAVADLAGQARRAVEQRAEYVAIMMGANDACAPTPGTMTAVPAFRARFVAALRVLDGLPRGSHLFVASVPDIPYIWELLHRSATARLRWSVFPVCLAALGRRASAADRARVRERIGAYNAVMAALCRARPRCRTDGGAAFRYRFRVRDVSPVDSFHPSLTGQAVLAARTWAVSWWPTVG